MRSFRSPDVSEWVSLVLDGDATRAAELANRLGRYPVKLTRSLDDARRWLKAAGRGQRRYGLVAFGGAGPLHAARLARALGIPRIIVPWGAGVGSAIGLLEANTKLDQSLTRLLVVRAGVRAGLLQGLSSRRHEHDERLQR